MRKKLAVLTILFLTFMLLFGTNGYAKSTTSGARSPGGSDCCNSGCCEPEDTPCNSGCCEPEKSEEQKPCLTIEPEETGCGCEEGLENDTTGDCCCDVSCCCNCNTEQKCSLPDKPTPDKPTPDKPTPDKPTPDNPLTSVVEISSIRGVVFLDFNGDGVLDINETHRISNSVVELSQNGVVLDSITTGKNGAYSFNGLTPGVYTVTLTIYPDPYDPTSPVVISKDVIAGVDSVVNFGLLSAVLPYTPDPTRGVLPYTSDSGLPPVLPYTGYCLFAFGLTLVAGGIEMVRRARRI